MKSLPLFDRQMAEEAREHALDLVEQRRGWMAVAVRALTRLAAKRQPFTTDDAYRVEPELEHCPERRILGAAVRELRASGVIQPTGRYVPSSRVVSHARPKREWVGV